MRINLIKDSLILGNEGKKCFYFEIVKGRNEAISSDLGVARLFNLDKKDYIKRLLKTFNNSYTEDRGEFYLTYDNLGHLTEEELINRFKEEFYLELIPVHLEE